MSFLVIFAMPAVMVASTTLILDRLVGTHFYNPAEGGDALLWQHLFWFFGHPEVYIIFLPGIGMVSEIVVTASRRPLFGYVPVVLANVATAVLAFGLWVHHMFATGLPQLGASFFTGASILIAIPTGVQFFCWIATLWGSRPRIDAQFSFVLAFFATFLIGGLTGVMLAAVPINVQVHDTFFVVAHFHYVLIGGAVFPLLGGLTHWFPKLTGRMLSERLGFVSCALVFVGFHVTFFPQHVLGLRGMPRRIYTYLPDTGWGFWNLVSTVGAFVLALGALVFVINALRSLVAGERAPANPWKGDTLEWAVSSPPPRSSERPVPVVTSRYPLWQGQLGHVTGLKGDEFLVTRVVDGEPDHVANAPLPSIMPVFTAICTAVLIISCIFTPWGLPVGAVLVGITLFIWFRPTDREPTIETATLLRQQAAAAKGAS
jgi:cytochrome c oxidase subunit 1